MDITYNIQQIGGNELLFNYTVNSVPVFILTITNPWTDEIKIATIPHEGTDGEWVLNITGTVQAYEDLTGGEIYFSHLGTWTGTIVSAGVTVTDVNFQIL